LRLEAGRRNEEDSKGGGVGLRLEAGRRDAEYSKEREDGAEAIGRKVE
jgi:hypothetical protein